MKPYLVDTTIFVQRLIKLDYTPNAIALFKQSGQSVELYAPAFGVVECVNVFWKYVRFQNMSLDHAENLIIDLLDLPLTVLPVENVMMAALGIGVRHQLAIYDSIYVALALSLGYSLITIDQKQAQVAKAEGVRLKAITDF
jgi:predicted nucleic acid-binding protein